jgi:ADP-heptose:LPS heptosyltransferase
MSVEGLRILVVHQGALGDFILALPAVKALREFLHPAWIEMMGHPLILALAHGHPYADAVTDINRADMAPFFLEDAPLPAEMCRHLGRFDAAFCFSQSAALRDNLGRAGIKKTYCLPPFPTGKTHATDHHGTSLKALGIPAVPTPPEIFVSEKAQTGAQEFFFQKGWNRNEIVALHPGAGSRKKAWPAARFAGLGRALAQESKKLLVIQGPADETITAEVVKGLVDIPNHLVHDLRIADLAALLSCVSLFIGNDSGISHLAAALKIPTLALFGPTDPLCWAPRGQKAFWLQGNAVCAPCRPDKMRICERQQCLDSIEVEAVIAFIAERRMLHPKAVLHQGPRMDKEPFVPLAMQDHHGNALAPQ